ncbi:MULTISPECIES: OBAP family protein [unclassified Rhizobacter]|uniref:OBAP family protein n=1 Tax=unclassified Rhizobacter TaxID=2640088 RepID=UPI0006FC2137|nr:MULTISPECIES: OBAP family protein [unclassified Rhizobacter]KQU71451.1 outer membrane or secreted lipoprotein [Rhizobacter sp. Root29]KQW13060.1 outer membrane or secreted lipoprotein [Rhizobacter sp. Root1238]KRB14367.1 outer membrane or secreted lipoprotein [Rhizobacter sp. Root16D2]
MPTRSMPGSTCCATLLACLAAAAVAAPPGDDKSATTRTLEAGAKLLQRSAPLAPMDVYLVGFHPMKEAPSRQMEAHHFCHQMNEDFAQCALFDGNTRDARLVGVEYIVSEKLFATLPVAERPYWHPHNGEILSGQLAAPGIPLIAEKALMRQKINSYGKTWHFWNTGTDGRGADALPLGPPMLAWSFNRDGELDPTLLQRHDADLTMRSGERRRQRTDLLPLARPQAGVDALKNAFPRSSAIPGVVDSQASGVR